MAWQAVQASTEHLRHTRVGRAVAGFQRNQQAITAGHLSFIGLVSLFPFLIVLVSVAAVIGSSTAAMQAIATALDNVPPDVANALGPVASEIMGEPRGGALTLGALMALWAASSAFEALRYAFNRAYGVHKPRQVALRRLQSLLITLLFATAIVLATLAVVVLPALADLYVFLFGRPEWAATGGSGLSRMLGAVILVAATAALYKILPRPRIRYREALPGALLAVAGWFVMAELFGLYLTEVGRLSVTYGSLGGVVATLVFFYVTACVVLFGCEFNAAGRRRGDQHA